MTVFTFSHYQILDTFDLILNSPMALNISFQSDDIEIVPVLSILQNEKKMVKTMWLWAIGHFCNGQYDIKPLAGQPVVFLVKV
jgi:hypothetical protein